MHPRRRRAAGLDAVDRLRLRRALKLDGLPALGGQVESLARELGMTRPGLVEAGRAVAAQDGALAGLLEADEG